MQNIVDHFVCTTTMAEYELLERRINILLNPRPKWLPKFIWKMLISKLLTIETKTEYLI